MAGPYVTYPMSSSSQTSKRIELVVVMCSNHAHQQNLKLDNGGCRPEKYVRIAPKDDNKTQPNMIFKKPSFQ